MTTQSRLESLPVELLHEVCSYLLSTHNVLGESPYSLNKTHVPGNFDASKYNSNGPASISHLLPGNPLRWLGSTSVHLRSVVESYSASLLESWADIVKIEPPYGHLPGTSQLDRYNQTKNFIQTRHLLDWIHNACVFCGRLQRGRRAILANNLACCPECDNKHWPNKIHLTQTKEIYHLSNAHLFDYVDRPSHWPMIRFGPYKSGGTAVTWFLQADVERLADAVHGDWKLHNEERRRKATQRKEKIIQNKRKHIESGECPGADGCKYCMDVRDADQNAAVRKRTATRRRIEYTEIPDDDEDREVWIDGMRRTAAEDPNWEAPVMV